jgi:hypothetical protein
LKLETSQLNLKESVKITWQQQHLVGSEPIFGRVRIMMALFQEKHTNKLEPAREWITIVCQMKNIRFDEASGLSRKQIYTHIHMYLKTAYLKAFSRIKLVTLIRVQLLGRCFQRFHQIFGKLLQRPATLSLLNFVIELLKIDWWGMLNIMQALLQCIRALGFNQNKSTSTQPNSPVIIRSQNLQTLCRSVKMFTKLNLQRKIHDQSYVFQKFDWTWFINDLKTWVWIFNTFQTRCTASMHAQ